MNSKKPISIFIVEDNEVYARSLQGFIQTRIPNINEIKIFRIGELCLMEIFRNPTIVIMDYFLNSKYEEALNGLEIIKRIMNHDPLTNIIVLSMQKNIGVLLDATEMYKCNYVQKDLDAFDKVEQVIREILKREKLPAQEQLN